MISVLKISVKSMQIKTNKQTKYSKNFSTQSTVFWKSFSESLRMISAV